MAKDPAFMFYSQDFIVGTLAMPFDERGRYITLICYQHQTGHMSEETIRLLVGSFSDILKSKFSIDENGFYYNERLDLEIEKRQKFIESRENNGKLGGRPKKEKKHMVNSSLSKTKPTENLTEDENEYVIITELFNKICIDFPKLKSCSKSRKDKIKIRLREMNNDKSIIENLFNKMQASDFLKGKNEKKWQATFDWVFDNDKNWVKVIEGNYDNKKSSPQTECYR